MASFLLYSLLIVTIHNIVCESLSCPKATDCGPCQSSVDSCTLDCIGQDYCKGSSVTLRCESGVPCIINCDGTQACTDSRLISNGATSVTITCNGMLACSGGAVFNCEPDRPCHVTCKQDNCDSLVINTNGASEFSCTNCPTTFPAPYKAPTSYPTLDPTNDPTPTPTDTPTLTPTLPTMHPSAPSKNPTHIPSFNPTLGPSMKPTTSPPTTDEPTTANPTSNPSISPTTSTPTDNPSTAPTTSRPTSNPTISPTTSTPTDAPTLTPTQSPIYNPSPTSMPTTSNPTDTPSAAPSRYIPPIKSFSPTTERPTNNPSLAATTKPPVTTTIASSNTAHEPSISHPSRDGTDSATSTQSVSEIHSMHSPSTTPTNNPTVNTINQFPESSESNFWKDDPYAYAVYVAIIFVVILLIVMAVCIYRKSKPSKQHKAEAMDSPIITDNNNTDNTDKPNIKPIDDGDTSDDDMYKSMSKINIETKGGGVTGETGEVDMDENRENKQDLTIPSLKDTAAITKPNGDTLFEKPTAGGHDEGYIVEMVLKPEQKKKMEVDLKERGLNELAVNDGSYAQNVYNAQQQDTMLMDNIVYDMKNSYDRHQNNGNHHYHQ